MPLHVPYKVETIVTSEGLHYTQELMRDEHKMWGILYTSYLVLGRGGLSTEHDPSIRRELFVNIGCLLLVLSYGEGDVIREGILKY